MTRPEAISFLERCRDTHRYWIDYYAEHPEAEQSYSCCVGEKAHHEEIVGKYDEVIELLKGS